MINHTGKLKKENGKLVYMKQTDSVSFEEFKKNLEEGDIVEIYVEKVDEDGTLAQLAMVHSQIRRLTAITGYSFSDMKLLIKEQAGLCLSRTMTGKEYLLCKSFGDCSREELSAAIEACKEIGEQIGHPIA